MKAIPRLVINAALAATVAVAVHEACEYPDDNQAQEVIAEQEDAIRKLIAESTMCMPDGSDDRDIGREDSSPKDVESPASVSDYEKLKNNYIFSLSYSCYWGRDSLVVATRFRHSCDESEKLLKDIDIKKSHCDAAIKLTNTQLEKEGLVKAGAILDELANNHHISPPQCPRKPLINR